MEPVGGRKEKVVLATRMQLSKEKVAPSLFRNDVPPKLTRYNSRRSKRGAPRASRLSAPYNDWAE